jgi:tetratricopeptide (TPR) repeat protein
MPPEEAMPKAREAARRAIELDDQIPDGHAALGIVLAQYDRDWAAAETELKKAIGLNPSYQTAHMYYGFLLSERRRFGEAVREFELAAKLDPLSRIPPEWAAWTLYLAGDYDRAIARYRTLEASDSTDVVPHYSMAICYLAKRMPQQALREVLYAGTDSTNNNVLAARCGAHALLGQRREALTQLELLLHPPPGKHSQNYPIALACACLGDRDQAFRWLEKCFTERDEDVDWLAADPLMRQLLGDDPRYAAMLGRLGPR